MRFVCPQFPRVCVSPLVSLTVFSHFSQFLTQEFQLSSVSHSCSLRLYEVYLCAVRPHFACCTRLCVVRCTEPIKPVKLLSFCPLQFKRSFCRRNGGKMVRLNGNGSRSENRAFAGNTNVIYSRAVSAPETNRVGEDLETECNE